MFNLAIVSSCCKSVLKPRILTLKMAIACLVLLHGIAAFFILRLSFNNAPELYFPKQSPAVVLDEQLRREFPQDEVLVALFSGPSLFDPSFLKSLAQVEHRLLQQPDVDRVFSVVSVERIVNSEEGFRIEPLIDVSKLTESTAEARQKQVMQDRFAPGWLAAKDGQSLALVVRAKKLSESRQRLALEAALRDAVAAEKIDGQLVAVAGSIAVDAAQMHSMMQDSIWFTPIVFSLGVMLLWWVVGRVVPVLIGVVAMSVVTSSSVALISALQQPYTLVTAMVPTLLSAYTIGNLLHLYAVLQRMPLQNGREAVLHAMRHIHRPALFNLLSTIAGMLSLVFISIPPIQVFGLVAVFGVCVIYLTLFYLVPPLLVAFDKHAWPKQSGGFAWTKRISYGLARFSMRYAVWVVSAVLLLLVLVAPQIAKVQVESDLLKFFSPQHVLTQSTQMIEQRLVGVTALEIVLDAPARDGFKSVERLQRVKALQDWVKTLPEVDRAYSMVDVVEEIHWAFVGDGGVERSLPTDDKLLSQLLLLYDGKDLPELVNREYQRTRILLSVNVHGANEIQAVIEKIKQHVASHHLGDIHWQIAGSGRLFSDQEDLLVDGQVNSFFSAFGQIFLILLLLWRSLPVAVIAMLPNLAPLAFIFVLMGSVDIPLNAATVLIASVVLGITVDDTIHFFHHYLERRRKGLSVVFSLARSFEASGRAVVAISVLLVAQFLVLTASDFQPTVDFGLLTSTGLLAGQILELLLLPALVVLWARLNVKWRGLRV